MRRYIINGVVIKQEETVKDLGVTFDRKLNFVPHHNANMKLARSMIGMAKRFAHNIHSPRVIVNVFRTYILPKIEFGHILWSSIPTRTNKLESLQSGVLCYALRRTPDLANQEPHLRRATFRINSFTARLQSQQFVVIVKILTENLVTVIRPWIIERQGLQNLQNLQLHRHINVVDLRKNNPLKHLCEVYNRIFHVVPYTPISIPTIKRLLRDHLQ